MGTMYDSTNPAGPPADGDIYAGYRHGLYPSYDGLVARFPTKLVLAIAVTAEQYDCDLLDVEQGDARPDQVGSWLDNVRPPHLIVPGAYVNLSNWQAAKDSAGARPCAWWVAVRNQGSGLVPGSVATQWASFDAYDVSTTAPGWPPPPPQPWPQLTFKIGADMGTLNTDFIPVQALDKDGHGWVIVPVQWEKVTGWGAQGPNPPVDGYWPPVHTEAQPHADGTLITLYGQPNQQCGVWVKHVD